MDDEAVAVLAPLVKQCAHVEVVPFVLRDAFSIIGIQPPVVVLVDVPTRVVPDALREARHLAGVGVPVPRRQVDGKQVQLEVVALPRVLRQLELLEELVQVQHVLGHVVVDALLVILLSPSVRSRRRASSSTLRSRLAPPLRVVLVRRDPQRAEGARPVRLDAVVRGRGRRPARSRLGRASPASRTCAARPRRRTSRPRARSRRPSARPRRRTSKASPLKGPSVTLSR